MPTRYPGPSSTLSMGEGEEWSVPSQHMGEGAVLLELCSDSGSRTSSSEHIWGESGGGVTGERVSSKPWRMELSVQTWAGRAAPP